MVWNEKYYTPSQKELERVLSFHEHQPNIRRSLQSLQNTDKHSCLDFDCSSDTHCLVDTNHMKTSSFCPLTSLAPICFQLHWQIPSIMSFESNSPRGINCCLEKKVKHCRKLQKVRKKLERRHFLSFFSICGITTSFPIHIPMRSWIRILYCQVFKGSFPNQGFEILWCTAVRTLA